MSARLPIALSATALGLLAVIVWQTLAPVALIADPPLDAAAARVHPVAPLADYVPPTEDQFGIINARPMFDPARQPVAEPAQTGATAGSPPELSLVGVAIGPWSSVALFKRPGAPAAITGRLGDTIDGWQLVRIDRDSVLFHAGAIDYTVKLRAAAGLPQPSIKPAAPSGVTDQAGQ
jgi:hypothetical protein